MISVIRGRRRQRGSVIEKRLGVRGRRRRRLRRPDFGHTRKMQSNVAHPWKWCFQSLTVWMWQQVSEILVEGHVKYHMISSAKIKPAELRKNLLKWPLLTRLATSYDDLFVSCSETEIWLIEKKFCWHWFYQCFVRYRP